MDITRKQDRNTDEIVMTMSSQEYDTLFYALKEYGNNLADSVGGRNNPRNENNEAEEWMFLGEQLHKVGSMMFAMQEHNRKSDDTRW